MASNEHKNLAIDGRDPPTNDGRRQFRTAADVAYDVISNAILTRALEPGQKLTRRGMAQLTGVSTIPVIEALHRLEDEGLVESEPHFGSHVVNLTAETIRDRFAMRLAVECQVVRLLARNLEEGQRGRIAFLADEVDSIPRNSETEDRFREVHYTFHRRLAEYSRCPSFVLALDRLNLFEFLRRSVQIMESRKNRPPGYHHRKVVDAILTGDPDHAERTMWEHISLSGMLEPKDL